MAVDQALLKILVCPENKTPVSPADAALVDALNRKIEAGTVRNRAGKPVKEKLDGGLIRSDQRFLYPIREDIPVMLVDEAIELGS